MNLTNLKYDLCDSIKAAYLKIASSTELSWHLKFYDLIKNLYYESLSLLWIFTHESFLFTNIVVVCCFCCSVLFYSPLDVWVDEIFHYTSEYLYLLATSCHFHGFYQVNLVAPDDGMDNWESIKDIMESAKNMPILWSFNRVTA